MIDTVAKDFLRKRVALVGMPNCGKTALFNQLTGTRQKIANYAGVTVERKSGECKFSGKIFEILDLPGVYGFSTTSRDEAITKAVCMGDYEGEPPPDCIICVIDATNLQLHLRFVAEVMNLGLPMLIALNMLDLSKKKCISIDYNHLSDLLAVPVIPTVAIRKEGIVDLLNALVLQLTHKTCKSREGSWLRNAVHQKFNDSGNIEHDIANQATEEMIRINDQIRSIIKKCVISSKDSDHIDTIIDAVVLHPIFGSGILVFLLFFMFQAVFSWSQPFTTIIASLVHVIGNFFINFFPPGILKDFLSQVIIAGCGTVLMFLPQILILFLLIYILEESGYLPRAVYLLDGLMMKCGLSGRALIPLLSSFACSIPGIMAARSIPDKKDRLITILVAPLATCAARLPIYTLIIGAFVPDIKIFGFLNLSGIVLFCLYALSIASIAFTSLIFKLCLGQSEASTLLLELPPYRLPRIKDLMISLYNRALIFLRKITGLLVSLTILLWFCVSFPRPPSDAILPAIEYSFAGKIGHFLEPLFLPLGFNRKIVIALIPAIAAREAIISALSTVYAVTSLNQTEVIGQLTCYIKENWTLPTAFSLLVWFVFSPQCLSMLVVIRKEARSTLLASAVAIYLLCLAYFFSFLTYQMATFFK